MYLHIHINCLEKRKACLSSLVFSCLVWAIGLCLVSSRLVLSCLQSSSLHRLAALVNRPPAVVLSLLTNFKFNYEKLKLWKGLFLYSISPALNSNGPIDVNAANAATDVAIR